MAYKTKFLHFKTKASYEAERAKTTEGSEERKVFDAYISFIDEGPTICTWGKEYQCDANSLSLLPQEVTTEKQNQALDNIGLNFMVIDVTEGKAVLTAEQETQLLSSNGVILKGDGLGAFESRLFVPHNVRSQIVYFYTIFSRSDLVYIIYTKATKTIEYKGSMGISDRVALHKEPESLSVEQQDQVFKNLGWKVHVISQSDINATTSPDAVEKTKRLEATALLVKETSLIYVRGNDDSSSHYFFKINSSSQLELLRISITTGIIYSTNSQFVDAGTIRYDRTQTLSDSNKTLARENIDAANKNDVLPLTIDLSSQTVEDYNTALEAFNSKKPLTIFDSTDPTSRFTANVIEKEATTNDINVYFSFTGINDANTFNTIGYVGTIKPTGEKTSSFAAIQPSNMDPKPLGHASPGIDNSYSRSDHVHPAQVDITGNAATATTATTATNLATKPILSRNENYIQVTVGNKISDNFIVPYASKTSAAETLMYGRKIFLNGDVTGSTTESFNGSKNVTINTTISTINAEKLTGTIDANRLPEIPIEKIPAAALERLFVVDSQSAAMSVDVQEGDVVQIGSGGPMYFCVSESASTFATKFKVFTAGAATSVPWSGVTGAPTKLSQFSNDAGYLTSVPAQTWASITGKPSTFTPSAHTQSYTTLTGSTTTANQAIVSNGTANGWTLKTLGSNAFNSTSYIPTSVSVVASTLAAGSSATASYDAATNKFTFGIPRGATGAQGPTGPAGTYTPGTNISISNNTINCTYTLPTATGSVLGGIKVGSNITLSSGTISLSKANVTSALGYTPANTSDIPEIPIALPNPYALTINGTSYTGSSAVSITTPKPLITTTSFTGTQLSTTINAGYSYSNTLTRTVTSLNGFSESNPDAVIISTNKIFFNASNAIKMDGLGDLAGGTYYIYCLSYMANGKVAVNGAVYA